MSEMHACFVCGRTFEKPASRGRHERFAHPEWIPSAEFRAMRDQESRDRYAARYPRSVKFLRNANAHARKIGRPTVDPFMRLAEGPCVYCGGEATGWDHIIPVHAGGPTTPENLAPACATCNNRKNRYTVATALIRVPMLCGWCWMPLHRSLSKLLRGGRTPRYFACSISHLNMLRGYQPTAFGHPEFPRPRHVEIAERAA